MILIITIIIITIIIMTTIVVIKTELLTKMSPCHHHYKTLKKQYSYLEIAW